MAYEEIVALDAETTIALGGFNRKTNKANPTQIEGYYLGKKTVSSPKSRDGVANLYILQTSKGNVGVWGKTNLDKKMRDAVPGRMTMLIQAGTQKTQNGEMYLYTVKQDASDTIKVSTPSSSAPTLNTDEEIDGGYSAGSYGSDEDESEDVDTYEQEEVRQKSALGAAERKAKLDAVLNKAKSATRK